MTGARTGFLLLALALCGCWQANELERSLRVWEMQDHDTDTADVRVAIQRGDLDATRAASLRLAQRDRVPRVPEGARPYLDEVRLDATRLGAARNTDEAATRLVAMTVHCAGCHQVMEVEPRPPWRDTPDETLWAALVFASDALWVRGWAELPDEEDSPDTWAGRRTTYAARLQNP